MRRHARAIATTFALQILILALATGSATAADGCPNESLRLQQQTTYLPECRAYEQVSPVAKNGIDVKFNANLGMVAGAEGGVVDYVANGSFGDAPGSFFSTAYKATRGVGGWSSSPLDVPDLNAVGIRYATVIERSADLSKELVTSRLALAPGAVEGNYNYYLSNSDSGAIDLIYSSSEAPPFENYFEPGYTDFVLSATPNFERILFFTPEALTDDAPQNGAWKLYEFADGSLTLVSQAANGLPSEEAVAFGAIRSLRGLISADGSRVFYSLGSEVGKIGQGGLYVRENLGSPIPISVSQRVGDGPEIKDGVFRGASEDGSVVYFSSRSQLTEDASAYSSTGSADQGYLYRYDLETHALVNVTPIDSARSPAGPALEPFAVKAVSPDGESIYFRAQAAMTEGAVEGNSNLYLWHAGQLRLVETEPPNVPIETTVRLSEDGRYAAFESFGQPTGYDNVNHERCRFQVTDGGTGDECKTVFVYDTVTGVLACVSCNPDGSPPRGNASLGAGTASAVVTNSGRVFFSSYDRLVNRDGNGRLDAYEWWAGHYALISTGRSDTDSRFIGASADGGDVFFTTDQQLVSQDTDNLVDLYDARRGGGLSTQNPPGGPAPCSGDGCRPAPAPAPEGARAASATAGGHEQGSRRPRRCAQRRQGEKQRNSHRKRAAKAKQRARNCRARGQK